MDGKAISALMMEEKEKEGIALGRIGGARSGNRGRRVRIETGTEALEGIKAVKQDSLGGLSVKVSPSPESIMTSMSRLSIFKSVDVIVQITQESIIVDEINEIMTDSTYFHMLDVVIIVKLMYQLTYKN